MNLLSAHMAGIRVYRRSIFTTGAGNPGRPQQLRRPVGSELPSNQRITCKTVRNWDDQGMFWHGTYLEHNNISDPCLFHLKRIPVCHEILNGVWEAIHGVWEAIYEPHDTENQRSTNYQTMKQFFN